jgi:hypothetical protein
VVGALITERDVHEAGLIYVVAGRVDDRDTRFTTVDLLLEFARQQVRNDGPSDATAEDYDSSHR